MSKRTYGHVLVLPSWCLVHPAADDEFVFLLFFYIIVCFEFYILFILSVLENVVLNTSEITSKKFAA